MLHVITWPGSGRLATMAHPRGGARLQDEMTALAEAGVDVLVSALTEEEADRVSLIGEEAAARAAGLRFVPFPVSDRGTPDPSAALDLAVRLAAEIRAGRSVVVHCFAGIGRSTVLAGVVLVVLGAAVDEALRLISAARGLPVPDSSEQEAWLRAFAASLAVPAERGNQRARLPVAYPAL